MLSCVHVLWYSVVIVYMYYISTFVCVWYDVVIERMLYLCVHVFRCARLRTVVYHRL